MAKRNTDSNKATAEYFEFIHKEDSIEPPPPGINSATPKFASLEDWLISICKTENPKKHIATFKFGIFESMEDYFIYLVGTNEYQFTTHSETRSDFQPKDMYYMLSKNEFKNLTREQVLSNVAVKLTNFTSTEKFKKSFLSQAEIINTEFAGQIWTK